MKMYMCRGLCVKKYLCLGRVFMCKGIIMDIMCNMLYIPGPLLPTVPHCLLPLLFQMSPGAHSSLSPKEGMEKRGWEGRGVLAPGCGSIPKPSRLQGLQLGKASGLQREEEDYSKFISVFQLSKPAACP